MDDQTWNLIVEREKIIWADVQRSAGCVRGCLFEFSRFVQQPEPVDPAATPTINLDGKRRCEAVAIIAYVLNQKLKLRGVNQRYPLTYTKNGANSDPFEVRFIWRQRLHRMKSNYNGNSEQVGNHRTETRLAGNIWSAVPFNTVFDINDAVIDFLLMAEIARRKCYDPQLDCTDKFNELPISFGVAIGILLVRSGQIQVQSYLHSGQLNDVFRSIHRSANARHLMDQAIPNNFSFGSLCAAVYEYYQLHDNVIV
jgi:hypothetical protein